MKKVYYHNLVRITGPFDIVDTVSTNLKITDGESFQVNKYLSEPAFLGRSDEAKFVRHWKLTHWGFIDAVCRTEESVINHDVAAVALHFVSEGGHLETLITAIARAHPRLHIVFSKAPARPGFDTFVGTQTTFFEGDVRQAEKAIDPGSRNPLETVWKMFAILPDPVEYVQKYKVTADRFWEIANEAYGLGEEVLRKAAEAARAAIAGALSPGSKDGHGASTSGSSPAAAVSIPSVAGGNVEG